MRVAGVDPATVDATAVAFRVAPRINAAGRLGRPDMALHLVLTDDEREADLLANELETLNRERQVVENTILREAIEVVDAWPADKRSRHAYVVWGEGWHEGVIGIVASRLVERFGRPVVLIAGEGDRWKGSGRSVFAFRSPCRPRRLRRPPGTVRWPSRCRWADDSPPTSSSLLPRRSAPMPTPSSSPRTLAPVTRIDAIVPEDRLRSSSRASSNSWLHSASGIQM